MGTQWTETEKAISERRLDEIVEWDNQALCMRMHKHLLPGLEIRKVQNGIGSSDWDYTIYDWEQVKAIIRADWLDKDGEKERAENRIT
jgi:hypothetical protein